MPPWLKTHSFWQPVTSLYHAWHHTLEPPGYPVQTARLRWQGCNNASP